MILKINSWIRNLLLCKHINLNKFINTINKLIVYLVGITNILSYFLKQFKEIIINHYKISNEICYIMLQLQHTVEKFIKGSRIFDAAIYYPLAILKMFIHSSYSGFAKSAFVNIVVYIFLSYKF